MSEYLSDYGLVVLFGIIALQAAGIPGLPGKTALVVASILAAHGEFAIGEVVAVAALAGVVGGYVGFFVGRRGGRRLLGHRYVARRVERPLAIMERFVDLHGAKAVFFARFLPGLKVVAALSAGMFGMRWRTFALWHALAAVGFALLFGLGSYWLGEAAIELAERYGLIVVGPAAALLVAAWLGYRVVRRRRAVAASA